MNRALRVLAPLACLAGCSAPGDAAPVGAAPVVMSPGDDPEAQNAACEACHTAEAAEWRASLHRQAFSNEAFARSFARQPIPFCQACHAPHADPRRPPPPWAAANGITCVSCHVADGAVRAAPTARSASPSPHPLARSAEFAGPQACAGCHEFEFPRSRRYPPGRKMQLTLEEHARSEYAQMSCADCHMQSTDEGAPRRVDHRFDVSRNPSLLRGALAASARRTGPDRVALELRPVAVGHAFPTGDLFRRVELQVAATGANGEAIVSTRYLARHFAPPVYDRPDPPAPDDRLTGPTTIEMVAAGARPDQAITWRVTYQRVDFRDAEAPERSTIDGELVLASGELPALTPEPQPAAAGR